MYDARERAIHDQNAAVNSAQNEGEDRGQQYEKKDVFWQQLSTGDYRADRELILNQTARWHAPHNPKIPIA